MRTLALGIAFCIVGMPPASASGGLTWLHDYDQALARAREEGKPIYLQIGGPWCPPCNALKAGLARSAFADLADDLILLELDPRSVNPSGRAAIIRYYPEAARGSLSVPKAYLIDPYEEATLFHPAGRERNPERITEYAWQAIERVRGAAGNGDANGNGHAVPAVGFRIVESIDDARAVCAAEGRVLLEVAASEAVRVEAITRLRGAEAFAACVAVPAEPHGSPRISVSGVQETVGIEPDGTFDVESLEAAVRGALRPLPPALVDRLSDARERAAAERRPLVAVVGTPRDLDDARRILADPEHSVREILRGCLVTFVETGSREATELDAAAAAWIVLAPGGAEAMRSTAGPGSFRGRIAEVWDEEGEE